MSVCVFLGRLDISPLPQLLKQGKAARQPSHITSHQAGGEQRERAREKEREREGERERETVRGVSWLGGRNSPGSIT